MDYSGPLSFQGWDPSSGVGSSISIYPIRAIMTIRKRPINDDNNNNHIPVIIIIIVIVIIIIIEMNTKE